MYLRMAIISMQSLSENVSSKVVISRAQPRTCKFCKCVCKIYDLIKKKRKKDEEIDKHNK